MADHIAIVVSTDGERMIAVYDDAIADLLTEGRATTRRASHVEPNPNGPGWLADMGPVAGPVLGPFPLRADALAAERAHLAGILPALLDHATE